MIASVDRTLWTFDGVATFADVPHAGAPVNVDQFTMGSSGRQGSPGHARGARRMPALPRERRHPLPAGAGNRGNPTLHTWDGTTLTELDSVGDYPDEFVEYGDKLYFIAQPISETPALFVLEDVVPPVTPATPTLPPTGGEVSPVLVVSALVLLLGGAGILVFVPRGRGV